MGRGTGRGSVFTRIQKIKRNDCKNLPVCNTCKDCKDKSICNNRENCNKCTKCKNCNDYNSCDKFYIYKRNVGEYRKEKNKKAKPIYENKKSNINKEISLQMADIHKGKYIDVSKVTLSELMHKVAENRKKVGKTKARAYRRNLDTIQSASSMPILEMNIQEITNDDIIDSLELITSYSQSIIDKIFGLINSAFKIAIVDKILYYNPLDNRDAIIKPKSKQKTKEIRAFNISEQSNFVKATYKEEKYGKAFRIDLGTGLRPGELLALMPGDYDRENELLHISRTLTRDENDKIIISDCTKTYSGDRFIPVTDEYRQDLIDAIDCMIPNENNLIFTHEDGSIINPITFNSVFQRVCKSIGIFNVTAYTMRHSFATRRVEAHMDIKLLAYLMGHKNIDTIYKNYVTIHDDFKKSEQERYERYMESVGLFKANINDNMKLNKIIALIKELYIYNPNELMKIIYAVKKL